MNKNNPYGYKVGYRENGTRLFVRYFMTYTYHQALFSWNAVYHDHAPSWNYGGGGSSVRRDHARARNFQGFDAEHQ